MIVYKITNKINGKIYIGQTIATVNYRWSQHCRNKCKNTPISNAIAKYGANNFHIETIDGANSLSELNYKEWFHIWQSNALFPNGYNVKLGGNNHSICEEKKKQASINSGSPPFNVWKITKDNGKSVKSRQYEVVDFEYYGKFQNITSFSRNHDIRQSDVSTIIKGVRQLFAKGFIIISDNSSETIEDRVKKINQPTKRRDQKPFKAYRIKNSKTGTKLECVGIFYNQMEAGRRLNVSFKAISRVLKSERNKTHGYMFKYIE